MLKFVLVRVGKSLPILVIATIASFFITHLMPGDPVRTMLGDKSSEAQVVKMRTMLHLDKPLVEQFNIWISGVLKLDFGESIFWKEPIFDIILTRIEPTFLLAVISILISTTIGVPIGLRAAKKRGKVFDKGFQVGTLLSISIPGFWLGIMAIQFFCVKFNIFPVAGYDRISEVGIIDALYHLLLPGFVLGVMHSGLIGRMTRTTMLEVMENDYLKTARAKGVKERSVINIHGFVNALSPIVLVVGFSFAVLLGGAVVIEQLFNIPGIGNLLISAILKRDYPLIQGTLLFISIIFVVVNMVVDIICRLLNPKERF